MLNVRSGLLAGLLPAVLSRRLRRRSRGPEHQDALYTCAMARATWTCLPPPCFPQTLASTHVERILVRSQHCPCHRRQRSDHRAVRSRADNELSGDASVAIGLFDRLELGASIQELESVGGSGDLYGFFGAWPSSAPRPRVWGWPWEPGTSPPVVTACANRIGINDPNVRDSYTGARRVRQRTHPLRRGLGDAPWLSREPSCPSNDWTLSRGLG